MNSKPKRVLVIDDEPAVVTYMVTLLADNGYATTSAENGRIGFERAKSDPPDLVCLDISMPEESGIRFYRQLRDDPQLAATPVIIVSGVTGLGGDPEPFKHFGQGDLSGEGHGGHGVDGHHGATSVALSGGGRMKPARWKIFRAAGARHQPKNAAAARTRCGDAPARRMAAAT